MNKNIHLREQTSFKMENECDPLLIILLNSATSHPALDHRGALRTR